jgi:hypothetical protein
MKITKLVLLALGMSVAASSSAQGNRFGLGNREINKESLLPAKGDVAIGVNWTTLVYAFTKPVRKEIPFNDVSLYGFYGKYFLRPDFAVRGSFFITRSYEFQDYNTIKVGTTNPNETVLDREELRVRKTGLRLGAEMRRGHGRIQGFYGAEVLVSFGSAYDRYTYGNALTTANPIVFGYNFELADDVDGSNNLLSDRIVGTDKTGMSQLGVRLFSGIEVFIFDKFSIGGELGFSVYTQNDGVTHEFRERIYNGKLETYKNRITAGENRRTVMQTEIFGGETAVGASLRATFHF